MTHKYASTFAMISCLAVIVTSGCVNLDARQPTTTTSSSMAKAPAAMLKATKNTSDSLVAKLKNVLPKRRSKSYAQEALISDNDPTRLDYDPGVLGPELYLTAARLSEQTGRYDAALEQYGTALKADGTNRNALIGLARLQQRLGKDDEAIRGYKKALEYYRGDAAIMNDLGLCYARNNQLDDAISALSVAVQNAPQRELYANNLAAALVEANRTDEAVARLSETLGPDVANYRVGYLLNEAGNTQQSGEYLARALSHNPGLTQAREMMDERVPQMSSVQPNVAHRNAQ